MFPVSVCHLKDGVLSENPFFGTLLENGRETVAERGHRGPMPIDQIVIVL